MDWRMTYDRPELSHRVFNHAASSSVAIRKRNERVHPAPTGQVHGGIRRNLGDLPCPFVEIAYDAVATETELLAYGKVSLAGTSAPKTTTSKIDKTNSKNDPATKFTQHPRRTSYDHATKFCQI